MVTCRRDSCAASVSAVRKSTTCSNSLDKVVVQPLEQGVVGLISRGQSIAPEEMVAAELRIRHMQDRQLVDPIAGPPPGLGMPGIEDLRPGQPQPVSGDRVAVPFPEGRGWGGAHQTHYPAGAAV